MKAVAVLVWDLPDDLDPAEWHKGVQHSADVLTTPVGCGEPDVRLPTQAFLGIDDVARQVLAVFAAGDPSQTSTGVDETPDERQTPRQVTYVLRDGERFGIAPGVVVLGLDQTGVRAGS